jgi:hypothetical protein
MEFPNPLRKLQIVEIDDETIVKETIIKHTINNLSLDLSSIIESK